MLEQQLLRKPQETTPPSGRGRQPTEVAEPLGAEVVVAAATLGREQTLRRIREGWVAHRLVVPPRVGIPLSAAVVVVPEALHQLAAVQRFRAAEAAAAVVRRVRAVVTVVPLRSAAEAVEAQVLLGALAEVVVQLLVVPEVPRP